MSGYVTDTHALLWHLYTDPRLSPAARSIFNRADNGDDEIVIPTIVLVEILFLAEKGRIQPDAVQKSLALLAPDVENYQIAGLDMPVVLALQRVARQTVPELPDRVIAATAMSMGLPLISRDANISRVSGLTVVWAAPTG